MVDPDPFSVKPFANTGKWDRKEPYVILDSYRGNNMLLISGSVGFEPGWQAVVDKIAFCLIAPIFGDVTYR